MKTYCIINLSSILPVEIQVPVDCLDDRDTPKYIYLNQTTAETELLRLAEEYPDNNYQLFESVASVMERGSGEDRVLYIEPQGATEV